MSAYYTQDDSCGLLDELDNFLRIDETCDICECYEEHIVNNFPRYFDDFDKWLNGFRQLSALSCGQISVYVVSLKGELNLNADVFQLWIICGLRKLNHKLKAKYQLKIKKINDEFVITAV